jgi:cell division protein FtsW
MVVNLGGILALIPLTGVPLPFMSYGGSYMLNLIILLSLSQRVVIENKQRKYRSEFRKIMGG